MAQKQTKSRPRAPQKTKQRGETRPVMFITYAYDNPDDAPVLDSSGTLQEARENRADYGYGVTYKVYRQADGTYGNGKFIESES